MTPAETVVAVSTADAMERLGEDLAPLLRCGDLLVLSGDLGAGKTTLTRGIGRGLGVRGPVTSPTFVLARVHPSTGSGPALVHVDAYRLAGPTDLDDLDLDASLADSVTVVEWGEGRVEWLVPDRLEIRIERPAPDAIDPDTMDETDPAGGTRLVRLRAIGARWAGTRWPA